MNIWKNSIFVAIFATLGSYFIGYAFGWFNPGTLNVPTIRGLVFLEIAAVFTSYMCTFMCVHQTRWNYPIGVLTTFLYSWLFYQWGMYGVAIFNLYLVFSLIYGWFRWGSDGKTLPVTSVDGKWWFGYAGLGLGIWALLMVVNMFVPVPITPIEAAIVILSGVAQFLLDNKKIETWFFWIAVNILSIYFYFQGGLYLVTFQYLFFLGNAFYGWTKWFESKRAQDYWDSMFKRKEGASDYHVALELVKKD